MRTDVAIATELRPPPYGGSNQFLLALRGELRRRGLRVTDGRVPRRARSVLLHSYLSDLRRRPSCARRGRKSEVSTLSGIHSARSL